MSNYVTMNDDITMPILLLTGFIGLIIACCYIGVYFYKRSFKQKGE